MIPERPYSPYSVGGAKRRADEAHELQKKIQHLITLASHAGHSNAQVPLELLYEISGALNLANLLNNKLGEMIADHDSQVVWVQQVLRVLDEEGLLP